MSTLIIPEATEVASASDPSEMTRLSKRIELLSPKPDEKFEGSDASTTAHRTERSPTPPSVAPAPLVRLTGSVSDVSRKIQVLQQLEGVVTRLGKEDFTAELRNLTEKDTPTEFAEFSYAEVSAPDRALLERGAVFYWVIGYDTNATGQVTRISEIRFRRSPRWGSRKLRTAADRAADRLRRMTENAGQR